MLLDNNTTYWPQQTIFCFFLNKKCPWVSETFPSLLAAGCDRVINSWPLGGKHPVGWLGSSSSQCRLSSCFLSLTAGDVDQLAKVPMAILDPETQPAFQGQWSNEIKCLESLMILEPPLPAWLPSVNLWINVFLLQPPLPSPSGLMKKVAMVVEMEVMYGFGNTDFYSLRMTWLRPLLSTPSVSCRGQHRVPSMTPFPGGDLPAT